MKKTYLNFMIFFHLLFFCFNVVNFKWQIFFIYLIIHLFCYIFFQQYEYYIKFNYNNETIRININYKDYKFYNQLETKIKSNKLIPIKFINESFIKSYI